MSAFHTKSKYTVIMFYDCMFYVLLVLFTIVLCMMYYFYVRALTQWLLDLRLLAEFWLRTVTLQKCKVLAEIRKESSRIDNTPHLHDFDKRRDGVVMSSNCLSLRKPGARRGSSSRRHE